MCGILRSVSVAAAIAAAAVMGTFWLSERGKKLMPESISEKHGTFADTGDRRTGASEAPGVSGTFTDTRDGQTYKTVKMPDGKTWMAENLNHEAGESWCYKDHSSNCAKYGRLYDWETALTVCPAGWRLPSYKDWCDLEQAIGGDKMISEIGTVYWRGAGKKMKAKSGWTNGGGTDDYGFSAMPSGARNYRDGGYFGNIGFSCGWWATTVHKDGAPYLCGLIDNRDDLFEANYDKKHGLSVRCVADAP